MLQAQRQPSRISSIRRRYCCSFTNIPALTKLPQNVRAD